MTNKKRTKIDVSKALRKLRDWAWENCQADNWVKYPSSVIAVANGYLFLYHFEESFMPGVIYSFRVTSTDVEPDDKFLPAWKKAWNVLPGDDPEKTIEPQEEAK